MFIPLGTSNSQNWGFSRIYVQSFIWNIVNVFFFQHWCSTYCKFLKLGSVFTEPFTFRYFTGYSVELQLTGTNRGKTARQTRKPFFLQQCLVCGQCSKSRKFLKIQGSLGKDIFELIWSPVWCGFKSTLNSAESPVYCGFSKYIWSKIQKIIKCEQKLDIIR